MRGAQLRSAIFLAAWLSVFAPVSWAQSDAELALNQARLSYQQDDFAAARTHAQQALQTDPNNPDIHLLLGRTSLQLGQVDEALSAFRKVLQFAPKHVDAARMVAALEGRLGDAQLRLKLVADLIQAGLLKPAERQLAAIRADTSLGNQHQQQILTLQTELALQSGDGTTALAALRELVIRVPDIAKTPAVRLLFARAHVAAGGDGVAAGLAELKDLAEKSPDTPQGQGALLTLLSYRQRQGEDVVKPLAAWIAANPNHPALHTARQHQRTIVEDLLQATLRLPVPAADAKLADTDQAALAAASHALEAFAKTSDQLALVQLLLAHF